MGNDDTVKRALLERVQEISGILRERRPDLLDSTIKTLSEAEARLRKERLLEEDLAWVDRMVVRGLCHPKYLYDFCPLERLEGETEQERWQRWGELVDQMQRQAVLLCRPSRRGRRR